VQVRGTGVKQLEVVGQLGHRAHRRPRAAHRIGLVDRNRRRHTFDPVHLRLVHAVEKLPGVGREGLDIAALPLGVQRVEHQRGFARAGHTGDHGEAIQRQIERQVAQIVLACAANADGRRLGIGCGHDEGDESKRRDSNGEPGADRLQTTEFPSAIIPAPRRPQQPAWQRILLMEIPF